MTNHLAGQTSPYLRQHAENPVDWYPWGDEAFTRARAEDRPILLSVGYSSCHWCHVMAHESFEDPGTAALMNELFVNVKVDREERPDVDAIYMDAVQALAGHGGWPMTVFLTPDGRPFFGGTYFPKSSRSGMISFTALCRRIHEVWTTRRDDLETQADQLTAALTRADPAAEPGAAPDRSVLTHAVSQAAQGFDAEWGGFGRAPKFPSAMTLDLLVRLSHHDPRSETMAMVTTTLDAMAAGGIYDHLGGGFSRYSTDRRWLVPHFEKMLYDQALLVRVYLHAWLVTRRPSYRQVVDETIGYVLGSLGHHHGGFFAAEDADSADDTGRSVEGWFYTWTPAEVRAAAGADADAAIAWWGVTDEGHLDGRSVLHRPVPDHRARPPEIDRARARLLAARHHRTRPGLDDKVLTEWNALMVSVLAEAAGATGTDTWRAAAITTATFLCEHLRRSDGRWLRSWSPTGPDGGHARHLAYAGDYAALVEAFTRLAEVSGQARWIHEARDTADAMISRFWDDEHGGLFTTGDDASSLITRPKDVLDNATPSANSMAAVALLRLAALTGADHYEQRARELLSRMAAVARQHPLALGHLLAGVDLTTEGIIEVVVSGTRPDLNRVVLEAYRPRVVFAFGESFDSPLWTGRDETGTEGRAYVCRDYTCQAPVTDPGDLAVQLDAHGRPAA